MTKWSLFEGCKADSTLKISVIHHIKRLMKKNHKITSVDPENHLIKFKHPWVNKALR